MAESLAYNIDCMEYLKTVPDKYFDLAVVDPPYGGVASSQIGNVERDSAAEPLTTSSADAPASAVSLTATISVIGRGRHSLRYKTHTGGIFSNEPLHWDVAPPQEYFDELARVSKDQIIWGGNYFDLPPTRCFLIWRKLNIPLAGFSMAPVEYAWTSFNANAAIFEAFSSGGSGRETRFHPTQKPVELYAWIYKRYAKEGF